MLRRIPSPFIYNNIRFRSRLEAQWACYFDGLRVEYAYEARCFILPDGRTYTPDFHLPEFGTYLEVKPSNLAIRNPERNKADALAHTIGRARVWLSYGPPPWFEQLSGTHFTPIPKALLTYDKNPHPTQNIFWIADERYIARNRTWGEPGNFVTPQVISGAYSKDATLPRTSPHLPEVKNSFGGGIGFEDFRCLERMKDKVFCLGSIADLSKCPKRPKKVAR